MVQVTGEATTEVDLAVVAYRDEDDWVVEALDDEVCGSVADLGHELARYPGETGALALVAVEEDFVLLVRLHEDEVRVVLSDAAAATEWTLARSALTHLGLPVSEIDDDADPVPAGDLAILTDLGVEAAELGELFDDLDLYPDEVLSEIADRLGFGEDFDALVGLED